MDEIQDRYENTCVRFCWIFESHRLPQWEVREKMFCMKVLFLEELDLLCWCLSCVCCVGLCTVFENINRVCYCIYGLPALEHHVPRGNDMDAISDKITPSEKISDFWSDEVVRGFVDAITYSGACHGCSRRTRTVFCFFVSSIRRRSLSLPDTSKEVAALR